MHRGPNRRRAAPDGVPGPRFALVAIMVALATVLTSCAWPQYRFDPARTGSNPLETTIGPANVGSLHLLWRVPGSAPTVFAHILFTEVGGNSPALEALDADTGTVRWSVPGNVHPPSIAEGGLAISCLNPVGLNAYDALTGQLRWSQPTTQCGQPTVVHGVVYTVSGGPTFALTAFSTGSGDQLWTTQPCASGFQPRSTPTVANGLLYEMCNTASLPPPNPQVVALDASDGTPRWTATLNALLVNNEPAVVGDRLYVSNNPLGVNGSNPPGEVFALNALTGAPVWTATISSSGGASDVAVADGRVFVWSTRATDPTLRALDAGTGQLLWSATTDVAYNPAPSVANGVVYTVGFDGIAQAFDARNGTELFQANVGGVANAEPVIAAGRLYVDTGSGLSAFGL